MLSRFTQYFFSTQSVFIPLLDTHTLELGHIFNVEANITTVRLMDPTDFHIKNVVHDWEEREKREGRYYKVLPTQVKTQMILINDAVWLFSKGLTELGIIEELTAPQIECKRKKPWPHGRRIIEFMKAVLKLNPLMEYFIKMFAISLALRGGGHRSRGL